jgi:hypothetical protein
MLYSTLTWIARRRRPIARRKSAALAAVIGLLFGAIGVGIYLRSFVDFALCIVLTMVAFVVFAFTGSAMTLLLCMSTSALYGFHRVRMSNRQQSADVVS